MAVLKINQRIGILRSSLGLSGKEFAEKLGTTRSTINNWETGGYNVKADDIENICKKCGVSADWLIGLSDVQSPDISVQEVCNYTGLSEKAAQVVHELKNGGSVKNSEYYIQAISKLFESGLEGLSVLDAIAEYLKISPANTYQLVTQSPDGIAIQEKYDASFLLLKSIEENLRIIREKGDEK